MEEILNKIKELRRAKGYTLENMANELNISASTYRKVEMKQTKLTVERLIDITKILEVCLKDVLDTDTEDFTNK